MVVIQLSFSKFKLLWLTLAGEWGKDFGALEPELLSRPGREGRICLTVTVALNYKAVKVNFLYLNPQQLCAIPTC